MIRKDYKIKEFSIHIMIGIGIESTAHTFGVSVVVDGRVISNEKKSYTTQSGGMIPSQVSDHHVRYAHQVLRNAIKKANISVKNIDYVGFSQSPGIGNCLRIGSVLARSFRNEVDAKLIPVNHCIAHLEIGRYDTNCENPIFLYVSGANTQVINYENERYRVFGETEDMGVGNLLDSIARKLDLGFPGGPKIEQLAKKTKKYHLLPYNVKGMNIVLGGLYSHVKQKMLNKYDSDVISNSVQETVFAMLTEICERALAHSNKTELLLGGGVGCNKRLQEMLGQMCADRNASLHVPKNEYMVDNAAMIAITANLLYKTGTKFSFEDLVINPTKRTDDVHIPYSI